MKAPGKSASTSPDEETGAVPSVAKLPIDPNGGRGELRALGGGKHDEWNQHLTAQLAGSLPEARGSMTAATVEGSLGALTGQIGIDPQDPVEGMLSAQMIAAKAAALDLYRRAWIPERQDTWHSPTRLPERSRGFPRRSTVTAVKANSRSR